MATQVFAPIEQSTSETKRVWTFDFTPDIPSGVTVTSVKAVHVPPSGAPLTPTIGGAVATGVYPITLGQLKVQGIHYLDAVATLSDGEGSSIRLAIPCKY